MSKSIGNVIDPNELVDAYGADAFRYFVLREVPFGLDGDFSTETFVTRFNTELANDLGNLLSRVLTMIGKYFDGKIPQAGPDQPLDLDLREIASGIPTKIDADLAALAFTRYLQDAWSLVTRANRYVEENAPWTLAKNGDMGSLGSVLYNLAESLRLIGLYLFPVMPTTSQKIWDAIGMNKQISACLFAEEQNWGGLKTGTAIQPGAQLFPRIDQKKNTEKKMEKAEQEVKQEIRQDTPQAAPAQPAAAPVSAAKDPIGIEDFMKVDLRVGKIVEAERVVKSDKLVKLKVDIGTETRQVVAGIGKSYYAGGAFGQDHRDRGEPEAGQAHGHRVSGHAACRKQRGPACRGHL